MLTDTLTTIFNADTSKIEAAFNRMSRLSNNFSNALKFDKMQTQLNSLNLEMNKDGKVIDLNTKRFVSQGDAVMKMVEHKKKLEEIDRKAKAFVASPVGMDELTKFSSIGTKLGMLANQNINVNKQYAEMTTRLKGNKTAMDAFTTSFDNAKRRFDMFNLSLLFGGLALERVSKTILNFMVPSMKQLEELNTVSAKKVMGVSAAFEFLKVSIFETLMNTPMMQELVKWVIDFAIWMADLVQKYPIITDIAVALAGIAGVLGAAGIAAAWFNQIKSAFDGVASLAMRYFGSDGKGGTVGGAMVGWKSFLNAGGFLLSGIVVGIGVSNLIADINKGDLGGALGDAIGTALGIGGMAAFALGSGPLGWILTITGGVVLAVTSLTADTRAVQSNIQTLLYGKDERDFFTKFAQGILPAGFNYATTGSTSESPKDLALTAGKIDYKNAVMKLEQIEKDLDKARDIHNSAEMERLLSQKYQLETNRDTIFASVNAIDLQTASELRAWQEVEKANAEIQKKKDATSSLGTTTEAVTKDAIDRYAGLYSGILQNTEKTQQFIDNTKLFGQTVNDVFGGTKEGTGVITQFTNFGKEILLDEQYFSDLKKNINDWAATETVKTVRIKYIHEGSSADTGGFFGNAGRNVDSLLSSLTGG